MIPRFAAKVDRHGPIPAHAPHLGPCHLWTASVQNKGYGQFRFGGTTRLAHVLAWVWRNGPVPAGLELDHLCRVRRCVNPKHLEAVTRAVNFRRGARAGALGRMHAAKTHCKRGHAYTPENTYERRGARECRACWKERRRAA